MCSITVGPDSNLQNPASLLGAFLRVVKSPCCLQNIAQSTAYVKAPGIFLQTYLLFKFLEHLPTHVAIANSLHNSHLCHFTTILINKSFFKKKYYLPAPRFEPSNFWFTYSSFLHFSNQSHCLNRQPVLCGTLKGSKTAVVVTGKITQGLYIQLSRC